MRTNSYEIHTLLIRLRKVLTLQFFLKTNRVRKVLEFGRQTISLFHEIDKYRGTKKDSHKIRNHWKNNCVLPDLPGPTRGRHEEAIAYENYFVRRCGLGSMYPTTPDTVDTQKDITLQKASKNSSSNR